MWPRIWPGRERDPAAVLRDIPVRGWIGEELSIEDTLTGSYFVHSPPAPRKVGMPLSAETPAPVSATPLRDADNSLAAYSTVTRRRTAWRTGLSWPCTPPRPTRSESGPRVRLCRRGSRSL